MKFLNDEPFHMDSDDLDRFYKTMYIDSHPSGCWVATTPLDKDGYANFFLKGKKCRRHRVAYEHFTGTKADDIIDHLCNNPSCCNPEHLKVSTQRENTLRSEISVAAINARKTHCINGHSLEDAYIIKRRRRNNFVKLYEERQCKVCIKIRQEKYKKEKKNV